MRRMVRGGLGGLGGLIAAFSAVLVAAAPMNLERFEVDPAHTYIGFNVKHMLFSTVKGKFTDYEARIWIDPEDITRSRALVLIDAKSLDTGNGKRDRHLRSADFFDVARFPTIRFASKQVIRDGDGVVVVGDLTIRDVTREVSVPLSVVGPMALPNGERRLGAEGRLVVDRRDFGLTWNKVMEGIGAVGDEVAIELQVEAVQPAD